MIIYTTINQTGINNLTLIKEEIANLIKLINIVIKEEISQLSQDTSFLARITNFLSQDTSFLVVVN